MNRYFAHVRADLTIDQIVVVSSEAVNDLPFPDSEPLGQQYLHDLYGSNDQWLQTPKTGEFRGRYARIGGTWLPDIQEFGPLPEPEPPPDPGEE